MATSSEKPIVLHLGDPIEFNHDLYATLESKFTIIRPSLEERQRPAFLDALRTGKWGPIAGSFKPFWVSGGEMGRWDRELISLLPDTFQVYTAAGAGYDWADVDVMAERGILYCNGATASTEAVADMALYHILSVFRNMQWSNMAARSGDGEQFLDAHRNAPFGAHNPQGLTLGVVGLGNIGYRIAQKAHRALDMKVVYVDVVAKSKEQEDAIGGATRLETIDEMLAVADCTVLAAPGQAGQLLDRERIGKIKKGARVVNIARGTLIDEEALADALEKGDIFAVGLDVHADEPNVNQRLIKNRNATLTSHTAGGALETTSGFEGLSMKNLLAVLSGEAPLTPVNKHLIKG
ncbi:hypothetical protein MCOR19_001046 [Pyricularia oryzae]|nr:hypothetical protein MCOR19_001046 [Pyricularia oryzae]KAI6483230.1 hypothetical protein MCOR18_004345 [Pyricularia oryzae]